MNNLSSTELKKFIYDCQIDGNHRLANTLNELLALREAGKEPVAWEWQNRQQRHVTNDEERARNLAWDGVRVVPLYAAPQLPAVFDEREAFETFIAERFVDLVDRRRARNGDQGYMAWDMCVAWIVWQARAAIAAAPKPEGE